MPLIFHRANLGPGTPRRAGPGPAALPAGLTGGLAGTVRGIAGTIVRPIILWPLRWCADRFEDWREHRQLRDLDDHLLRDIGITAADVQRASLFRRRRGAQDPKGKPTWPTTF